MSSPSKEICGPRGLGAAVCWKGVLCTVLFQDFPVWGQVTVWLTFSRILNPWGSIAWWQGQYQPVPNCSSLILAVQVTWQWSGESSPARNRRGHRVTNTGSSSRSTSCPHQAHSLVLVTHEGQGERPRERRCTGELLRWRRVWREQELWIVPKEGGAVFPPAARWGNVKSFHRWTVTLLGEVSRLTQQPQNPALFFLFPSGARQV